MKLLEKDFLKNIRQFYELSLFLSTDGYTTLTYLTFSDEKGKTKCQYELYLEILKACSTEDSNFMSYLL